MNNKYTFNISLSVLNHLGRNLYRNIITIIGEAISNSWDADAHNVWVDIDKENNFMSIRDDGEGMSSNDFQEKFLKIGYSKRKGGNYYSTLGRPFIGRKGIGKLALLSCAQKIHVVSKQIEGDIIGGVIDNSALNQAITDDLSNQEYVLEYLSEQDVSIMIGEEKGTEVLFENLNNEIFNTIDYIKKAIVLYFRFSLIDPEFNIFVNDELINEDMLGDLADHTQFLWVINDMKDPFLDKTGLVPEAINIHSCLGIKGYIASVKKPSNVKIRGTQEKVTIDIFVNGRLREKDILRYIPTARIVENYVYGQIHYDSLDQEGSKDIFTSNREGIISNDPNFQKFLIEFEKMFKQVIDDWDELRRTHGDDGDVDNRSIKPKERKAEELFNTTIKEMNKDIQFAEKGTLVDDWVKMLRGEAQYNIPSYTECFIAENLLRQFIKYEDLELSDEAVSEAQKWKKREIENKNKANISYGIRTSDEDIYYLDMSYLSNFVDKSKNIKEPALSRSAIVYNPVRDAVAHTSIITAVAKTQLTVELENIKARVADLLKMIKE